MTIKELILKLNEFPQEYEVEVSTPDGTYLVDEITDFTRGRVTFECEY